MRCLTLADFASESGHQVIFIMRSPNKFVKNKINNHGHSLKIFEATELNKQSSLSNLPHGAWLPVSQEVDANESVEIIRDLKPSWTIVDHYAIDAIWHDIVSKVCSNLVVIDDLADRALKCKILIDQNYGADQEFYKTKVNSDCTYLMGPAYALLRNEFLNYRQLVVSQPPIDEIKKVLITFGGADPENFTTQVLNDLSNSKSAQKCQFIVIVGSNYPHLAELKRISKKSNLNIQIKFDVDNMAQVMAACDVCIGAAGTTALERCSVGLPTLTFVIAANQKKVAKMLAQAEITEITDINRLRTDFESLFSNRGIKKLNKLRQLSFDICDAQGASRVLAMMKKLNS